MAFVLMVILMVTGLTAVVGVLGYLIDKGAD
jgi:hypothetical protein